MTLRPDETWHRLLNWTYGSTPSERLAGLVLLDQDYKNFDPTHPLGGPDGGKDALCSKDGKRWIMAVYFPRGQKSFNDISTKFKHDLDGVAKNGADGIVFVTNQELTESERTKLKDLGGLAAVEVYHLERLALLLDQPRMELVRQKFLFIEPEQRSVAAEETATVQEPKKPYWVWRCTDESIAAGQISVLAIGEIPVAMAWYWWLVARSEWSWIALIGMVAAPMLLLRSEKSIARGIELLRNYWQREEKELSKKEQVCIGIMPPLLTFLVAYWLVSHFFTGYTNLVMLSVLGGVLGVFTFILRSAVVSVVVLGVTGVVIGTCALATAGVGTGALAAAGVAAGTGVVEGLVSGAVLLASQALIAGTAVAVAKATSYDIVAIGIAFLGAVVSFWFCRNSESVASFNRLNIVDLRIFGATLGIAIRSAFIRLHATSVNLGEGFAQLPQNWHETILTIDLSHPPELLPQAGTVADVFSLKKLLENQTQYQGENEIILKIFSLLLIATATSYRWSLKASAFLWFPLILALTPPLHKQTPQKTRKILAVLPVWQWTYIGLATLVMVWMLSPLVALTQWLPILPKEFILVTANLPAPPTFGLSTFIAVVAAIFTVLLIYRSKNAKAAWAKPLESPIEFSQLEKSEYYSDFLQDAKKIANIKLWLISSIILWGYAIVLGFAYHQYPAEVARFIWPWLLALL